MKNIIKKVAIFLLAAFVLYTIVFTSYIANVNNYELGVVKQNQERIIERLDLMKNCKP